MQFRSIRNQILLLCVGGVFFQLCPVHFSLAQTGFEIFNNEQKARVPFIERNNLVIVPITLNNKVTLRFVLDSGVRGIILTEKYYAKFLGLQFDRDYNILTVGKADSILAHVVNDVEIGLPAIPDERIEITGEDTGNIGQKYDLTKVQIAVPAISAKRQSLIVLEKDYLNLTESLGIEVYGIIGYPLFRQFAIEIDHGDNVITFHNPKTFVAPSYMTRIPIEVENSKPYIITDITGIDRWKAKAKLLVDLGASHALFLDVKSSNQLNKPEKTLRTIIGHGLGGEIKGEIGRLKKISIGPYELGNVIASFPDSSYYEGFIELEGRNGTIGGEILSRFDLAFNYLDSSLYFSKGSKFKNPFEYNMSGIQYRLVGQDLDRLFVLNVRKDSPADKAGIQIGDQITKINRHKVGSDSFGHIANLLQSKEGKKINVKLIRGFQLINSSFNLKRQI